MEIWALILAAGSGSRLSSVSGDCPKQFLPYQDVPIFWKSAQAFARIPEVKGIMLVMPQRFYNFFTKNDQPAPLSDSSIKDTNPASFTQPAEGHFQSYSDCQAPEDVQTLWENKISQMEKLHPLGLPWKVCLGGTERQHSVANALKVLPYSCQKVLIHDSARVFVSALLIKRVLNPLLAGSPAVIPGLAVTDTIKSVTSENLVSQTYERKQLRAVQTPQGFDKYLLQKAHDRAEKERWQVTDDSSMLELCGHPVLVVDGDPANIKITTREDLALLKPQQQTTYHCTGFGYDVHRYGGNRPMILGGVPIATDITIEAHSDGDVVLHALIDAILGCLGLGDIGTLFPDSDKQYESMASGLLLAEVLHRARQKNLHIEHTDITIVAQTPRVAPHRENIARNIAKMLGLPFERVNVKSTTEERMGFTGEKKGIKAMAVVSSVRDLPEE